MTHSDRHPSGLLAEFAEGSLAAPQAERVSRHVSSCSACEQEIERWQELYQTLTRLPRPRVSASLHARILEAVAHEVPVPASVWAARAVRRRRWVAALSWAYAAGVALVAATLVGLTFVPAVREAVGTTLARASSAGLRTGLSFVDLVTFLHESYHSLVKTLTERFEWVRVFGHAVQTLGTVAQMQLAVIGLLVLFTVVFSYFFVRFLHQRDAEREVSHVGLLVA
jgi:anti-sigma factor RsiW